MHFNEISFVFMSVAESNASFNEVDETIANFIDPDETSSLISSESMKLSLQASCTWQSGADHWMKLADVCCIH